MIAIEEYKSGNQSKYLVHAFDDESISLCYGYVSCNCTDV